MAVVSTQGMSMVCFRRRVASHVEQHHGGDAGDHSGENEDDRHQWRGPPGIGLDGAEDKADVAVEDEGGGDADEGDDPTDPCRWRGRAG